jgi:hypothetical protein
VFEFVRRNHPHLPEDFRRALERDLPRRRHYIADLARKAGDFDLLEEIWSDLQPLYRTAVLRPLFAILTYIKSILRSCRRVATNARWISRRALRAGQSVLNRRVL